MNDHDEQTVRAGGMPVLSTGLNLAELDLHGGHGFWTEVRRFASSSRIDQQLDLAMGGRSAPRIWAFLESPGAGPAAAAAALAVAWMLAERGQLVLLIDADEQELQVTRWLGRIEQEGWVDMVRFGVSLQAASVPLPSDGCCGCALGVGSFSPTGVTPDEVAELLNRLRSQADDLILVLPARLRSLPWIEAAHMRLLCWDLLSRSTGDTERILADLDCMGAKPDVLLGFGVEEYSLIQGSLREEPAVVSSAAAEKIAPKAPVAEVAQEPEQSHDDAFISMNASCETSDSKALHAGAMTATEGDQPPRRTSRIFVFMAAAAVISLVLLGFFLRTQLDPFHVSQDLVAPLETAAPPTVPVRHNDTDLFHDVPATSSSEADAPSIVGDHEPNDRDRERGEGLSVATQSVAESLASVLEAAAVDIATMDWSPYRQAPGPGDWTLWLYSVPNAQSASAEVRRLEALGIRAATRTVELPEQGRWWRIYAGRFSSRDEAQQAAGDLLIELKHDWAVPAHF